jgi:hypothetical protein
MVHESKFTEILDMVPMEVEDVEAYLESIYMPASAAKQ